MGDPNLNSRQLVFKLQELVHGDMMPLRSFLTTSQMGRREEAGVGRAEGRGLYLFWSAECLIRALVKVKELADFTKRPFWLILLPRVAVDPEKT